MYPPVTQFETRHRLLDAELERAHALAAGRRVVTLPRRHRGPRRWFRALRGATA